MGIGTLVGELNGRPCAVLVCTTSGEAFGPTFEDADEVEAFLDWLGTDPRKSDRYLSNRRDEFRREREARENAEHEAKGGMFGLRSPWGYLKPSTGGRAEYSRDRLDAAQFTLNGANEFKGAQFSHCEVVRL